MACGPARYRVMPWTAVTRSRKVLDISSGVKTGIIDGVDVTGAGGVGDPAVVIGAVVMMGSSGVGGDDDMIEPESLDTKLVETRVLLGLGHSL